MAASKQSSQTKKKNVPSTQRRGNVSTATKSARPSGSENEGRGVVEDILLLLFFAAAILLFISNFGVGGAVGETVSSFFFGLFGVMAYAFPLVVFFGVTFYIANRRNPLIIRKMIGLCMVFISLCALCQLLLTSDYLLPVMENYSASAEDHTAGGLVGGAIIYLFVKVADTVFAYILTIVLLAVSLIILTQRPLFTGLGRKGRDAAVSMKEKRDENREERLRQREEARAARHLEEEQARENQAKLPAGRTSAKPSAAKAKEKPAAPAEEPYSAPQPIRIDGVLSDEIEAEEKAAAEKTTKSRKGSKKKTASAMPSFLEGVVGEDETDLDAERERQKAKAAPEPFEDDDDDVMIGGFADEVPHTSAAETRTAIRGKASEEETASEDRPRKPGSSFGVKTNMTKEGGKVKTTAAEIEDDVISIEAQAAAEQEMAAYELPDPSLLNKGEPQSGDSRAHLLDTARKLQETFESFGVRVNVTNVSRGPTVTRYELQPEHGVKVSKILSLSDDIKLNLATSDIRIEAPIPGKAAVGIEVPNKENATVYFRDLIESEEFRRSKAPLTFAVGKDIGGKPVIANIEKMPHLLIAGATGSGKSVCINTLVMSVLYKSKPDEVRMLMIDPKVVELKIYDGIPHLLIPVVTDPKKASGALNWAVQEMTKRYNQFAEFHGVRDIHAFNERIDEMNRDLPEGEKKKRMPHILIIVDELADLMMVAPSEVEDAIVRLTQLARAAGLHLVIATQRPSVNVITGLIKANMPSRIALAVSSGVDSRTIIDMNGAEKLLGKGDMLFYPQGYPKPARVQGAFLTDGEITKVVNFVSSQTTQRVYNGEAETTIIETINHSPAENADSDRDEYFIESGRLIIEKKKASIGMLQRMFKIGFNRAARIMDQLAEAGVVGPEEGTKPRRILMTEEEFDAWLEDQA